MRSIYHLNKIYLKAINNKLLTFIAWLHLYIVVQALRTMLVPSTITVRRPSGESDFILTRVDSLAVSGHPEAGKGSGNRAETADGNETIPFQRPKANSASCIIDGIKARWACCQFYLIT